VKVIKALFVIATPSTLYYVTILRREVSAKTTNFTYTVPIEVMALPIFDYSILHPSLTIEQYKYHP